MDKEENMEGNPNEVYKRINELLPKPKITNDELHVVLQNIADGRVNEGNNDGLTHINSSSAPINQQNGR